MNGMQQSLARFEKRRMHGRTLAVITIDNPPVNAASRKMRADLLLALELAAREPDLAGVIMIGANGNFVAGSDIREFDAPPETPHLPEVIAALEACPVPVVAAIDGTALGGGFELALGCDARLATPRAVVGLPEVTLGLIPGAGGTFRLPRLVGGAEAIRLVTSGRRVGAAEAQRLGMVDALAEGDLLEAALAHLAGLAGRKRRLRDLPPVISPPTEIEAAEAAARRKAAGADAVEAAIAAIHAGLQQPAAEALAAERATSLRLRLGEQSRALRHLFFAERAALRPPAGAAAPKPVSTVGIVGAGQMGRGIALAFAMAGYRIRLAEAGEAQLAAGLAALETTIGQLAAKGRIPSAEALSARISGGPLQAMAECDLVIEAIIEDMEAKARLLTALDELCGPATILASNTSYLDINALAAATRRPAQVAGLHFFNPAHVMRLIEIVRTNAIAPETEATLLAVSKTLGKVPVVASVAEGFIGNRIFSAYRRQAEFLVEEGALPEEVDRAMRDFGMAMGPFAVFDLAGLDIAWATRKRLASTRDPRQRYATIADRLCQAGRFGRKTGRGWYDYAASPAGSPDPEVRQLIERASAEAGMIRRPIAAAEIDRRLLAAIVNEAALVLAEKIARRPSDIDLVFVHGYGFPAVKGGPLYWAANQPREIFRESVAMMADKSGVGIAPAENLDAVLNDASAGPRRR